MKYDNTHYYEAPRIFWPVDYKKKFDEKKKANVYTTEETDKYKKYHELSVYAKWLYQTLKPGSCVFVFKYRFLTQDTEAVSVRCNLPEEGTPLVDILKQCEHSFLLSVGGGASFDF